MTEITEAKEIKEGNTVMSLSLSVLFFILRTFLISLIIIDLIKWFEIPATLNIKQLFGITIAIRLLIVPVINKTSGSKESNKDIIMNNIMAISAMLAAWFIFYVIYSLIFK